MESTNVASITVNGSYEQMTAVNEVTRQNGLRQRVTN